LEKKKGDQDAITVPSENAGVKLQRSEKKTITNAARKIRAGTKVVNGKSKGKEKGRVLQSGSFSMRP